MQKCDINYYITTIIIFMKTYYKKIQIKIILIHPDLYSKRITLNQYYKDEIYTYPNNLDQF